MKRMGSRTIRLVVAAAMVLSLAQLAGAGAGAASAATDPPGTSPYPVSTLHLNNCFTGCTTSPHTDVVLTWYNRSVGVSGTVYAEVNRTWNLATQVALEFWTSRGNTGSAACNPTGSGTRIGVETRTISNIPDPVGIQESRGFSFTEDASNILGGIQCVRVTMYYERMDSGSDAVGNIVYTRNWYIGDARTCRRVGTTSQECV